MHLPVVVLLLLVQSRWARGHVTLMRPGAPARLSGSFASARALGCTADWASTSDPAVRACCEYSVTRQPAVRLRGEIPSYVNGSFYHAVFVTNLTDDYPGPGTVGAVLSVDFSDAGKPLSSFRYNEGTKFAALCNRTAPPQFAPSNAVTVVRMNGTAVVVATGVPEVNHIDARTLAPLATPFPLRPAGGFPGPAQLPRGHGRPHSAPSFYSPGHLPTDVNGDVYGYVYLYTPRPGYEVFRVPAGRAVRERLATVDASLQFASRGRPAFSHQALALTPSFIVLVRLLLSRFCEPFPAESPMYAPRNRRLTFSFSWD
eukprot:SAG31_NODE_2996_length_4803_cov_8.948342_4_plen_315_part_00